MEIEVIKKLIKKHTICHTNIVWKAIKAESYYRNKNDILIYDRKKNDDSENPLRNADNRISSNFHGLLVNQKASYMFTAPPLFDVGNKESNKRITDILGDNYAKACKDLCINAANSGIAWLHYWLNDDKQLEYGVVDSKQIIPIWSSSLNKKLLGILRVYNDTDDKGITYDIYEYWNDTKCQAFRKKSDLTIEEGLEIYTMFSNFIADSNANQQSNEFNHGFERVPFIPFGNNNLMTSDLDNVKPLIDVYDKVFSGFVNDLEDIQEIIFILTNYEGEDSKEFLSQLKKYKTVKVNDSGAGDRSGLQTLTIDIPIEAREKLLTMTRKAIFEQGQGVDPQQQDFGNASGVALKFLYSLLELKAGLTETEFKLGFGEFIRAICKYLNVECKSIIQTWTRTAITNDSELADICTSSVGLLSNMTLYKNHPFVEDADKEVEQKKKEDEEKEQVYPPNFNKDNSDDNSKDGELNE
ncbi:phage portal protein [Clostridium neonatale]|uniref:Phage portal protein, SPP1 family n=3 Tax=Clostridium neonatale TaxID=137838 RepID=A0A650MMQ3_9CLOT|nr:phage portal protein [Clostridium neonatale]CAG9703776.1 Putative phage portal protein, SPP1 family [Clostridium neonatale]CAG9719585.1 Putative phage portal protein, SPP1 family [Clostridium neonatale]CAI3535053.1 putative phage portal protein, SPP1 family [Clostridium neonatale]CAI3555306.1 putative phage portal protein, SPP1 family [Clostridium neonatale]CAI3573622.1 putative phage portal protein, SPP1 family [Clostridium neonatale]